jgi:hypothetical protein
MRDQKNSGVSREIYEEYWIVNKKMNFGLYFLESQNGMITL